MAMKQPYVISTVVMKTLIVTCTDNIVCRSRPGGGVDLRGALAVKCTVRQTAGGDVRDGGGEEGVSGSKGGKWADAVSDYSPKEIKTNREFCARARSE